MARSTIVRWSAWRWITPRGFQAGKARLNKMVTQLFPSGPLIEADALLHSLRFEQGVAPLRTGDLRVLEFLDEVGRKLRAPDCARRYPELAPLGAFLRRNHL